MKPQALLDAMEAPIRKTLEIVGHSPEEIDQISNAMIIRVFQLAIMHFVTSITITDTQLTELNERIKESPIEAFKLALSYAKTPDQLQECIDLAYREIIQTYLQGLMPSLPESVRDHLQKELESLANV